MLSSKSSITSRCGSSKSGAAKPCATWHRSLRPDIWTSRVATNNTTLQELHERSEKRRLSCRAASQSTQEQQAAGEQGQQGQDQGQEQLSAFLGWLVANGVQGIGQADSPVALYNEDDGERGLLACADLPAKQPIVAVPLRLALTDHPGDEASNALLYEGAPWSVRLAARLLRELAQGPSSPWWQYLMVLPLHVPAPLESFSWEDMKEIQYGVGQDAVYSYSWLVSDAYSHCSPEALGGASSETFQWAMSVVHSRTFGSAAKEGGVGVRMLVPLIDMLNHAGDEAQLLLDSRTTAMDNVRWDLVPPGPHSSGWAMVLSTTRDIVEGEPLQLSYGERSNDDFFVHYGFVPRGNPHDDVVLFSDLEQALEWHYVQWGNVQGLPQEELQALYQQAYEQAAAEQQQEVQAHAGAALDSLPQAVRTQLLQLKVMSGARVTQPLMSAFGAVSGGALALAEVAVARRCWQLLQGMSPLVDDLALLQQASSGEEVQGYYAALKDHYQAAIARCTATWGQQSPGSSSSGATQAADSSPPGVSSQLLLALSYRVNKKMLLWDLLLRVQPAEQDLQLSVE